MKNKERFVSYEKMSKNNRRKYNNLKRNYWSISPYSRVYKSKKLYARHKLRKHDLDDF